MRITRRSAEGRWQRHDAGCAPDDRSRRDYQPDRTHRAGLPPLKRLRGAQRWHLVTARAMGCVGESLDEGRTCKHLTETHQLGWLAPLPRIAASPCRTGWHPARWERCPMWRVHWIT